MFSLELPQVILMSAHNIPCSGQKDNHPELFQICSYGIISWGFKNEFKTAVVNEPSVSEPLKFYCSNPF